MKNLLILLMVIFGLTSCSKDSLDLHTEIENLPEKSEIMVRVNYLSWTNDQCGSGCGNFNSEEVSFIINAKVNLYLGEDGHSDESGTPFMDMRTDNEGSALLKDIDPGTYTVRVETELGTKSRTLNTQLNRRSYIDFSF